MSITVINYLDQALVDNVNTIVAERAAAQKAAEEAMLAASTDFATALDESSQAYTNANNTASKTICPKDLDAIFEEASETYGVSSNLLKSIAKAESGFNSNAVSHAGAVGIMQLMPETAASLGVSNSYDPRENIMGGARLIAQLLSKYNGNTALALAAYNAGSGNVEKYGGIPPFAETQNYVRKVISYMNGNASLPAEDSTISNLSDNKRDDINEALHNFFSSQGISKDSLDLLASLLTQIKNADTE